MRTNVQVAGGEVTITGDATLTSAMLHAIEVYETKAKQVTEQRKTEISKNISEGIAKKRNAKKKSNGKPKPSSDSLDWTAEEDKMLTNLYNSSSKTPSGRLMRGVRSHIAGVMGRTELAVACRIRHLGLAKKKSSNFFSSESKPETEHEYMQRQRPKKMHSKDAIRIALTEQSKPKKTRVTYRRVPLHLQQTTHQMVCRMVKEKLCMTYESDAWLMGIESLSDWNAFAYYLLQDAPSICRELGVTNHFKITGRSPKKICYGDPR